jgi:hypothetical protein
METDVTVAVPRGKAVSFAGENADTRVLLGSASGKVVPLYWSATDTIRIYSAQTSPTQADYGVDISSNRCTTATLHALSSDTLRWGSGLHTFTAFVPATASDLTLSPDAVHVTLPSVQDCQLGQCNGNLIYMAAACDDTTAETPQVSLQFQPIVTLLQINFQTVEATTLERVVLSADVSLAGTFDYDLTNSALTSVANDSKVVVLRVVGEDGSQGVACAANTEYTLYAVVLAQSEISGLRVDLLTSAGVPGRTISRTLTGGRRYSIDLDKLPSSLSSYSAKRYSRWMSYLPDDLLLSSLSLPGTHDAATSSITYTSSKCQSLTLAQQMPLGVRYLDLRPGGYDNLMIYHSSITTNVTFDAAIAAIDSFLSANPNEGVIAQIREETGNSSTWKSVMGSYLNTSSAYRSRFVGYHAGMTLGELRGKILILSRDEYEGTLVGGYISGWGDNATDNRSAKIYSATDSEALWLQDKYESTTGTTNKIKYVEAYLDLARDKAANQWLCSFCSLAYGLTGLTIVNPESNAKTINKEVLSYLQQHPGSTGILLLDFAGDSGTSGDALLKEIVNQNFH